MRFAACALIFAALTLSTRADDKQLLLQQQKKKAQQQLLQQQAKKSLVLQQQQLRQRQEAEVTEKTRPQGEDVGGRREAISTIQAPMDRPVVRAEKVSGE